MCLSNFAQICGIPPREGRVSMLVVRASHVTNCLRFRLAQRYLQVRINLLLLTGIEQTHGEGVGGPQTIMPDSLFARPARPNSRDNHASLITENLYF